MRKIFKNSFFYGAGELLRNAAAMLMVPLYTRFMDPREYGIVAMISATAAFLSTLFMMGQSDAIMRFYFEFKNEEKRKLYISSISFFCITVFLVFSLASMFYGKHFFNKLFPQIPFHPYGILLVWIVFFSVFESIAFMLLKTEEKAKSFSVYNLTGFVFNAAIVILFVVYFRMGAFGKVSADLLYAVVASVFFIRLLRKYITCKFSFRAIKATLRFGLPLVPHQVSLWTINLSDRYCLQLLARWLWQVSTQ